MKVKIKDLENETIVDRAMNIAEYFYDVMELLPESEKFNLSSKIRYASGDLIFYLSQAQEDNSGDSVFILTSAIKNLSALKTMYRFIGKRNFIKIDPEIMIQLDNLKVEISANLKESIKNKSNEEKEEFKPWLEKYRLWKEMQQ